MNVSLILLLFTAADAPAVTLRGEDKTPTSFPRKEAEIKKANK